MTRTREELAARKQLLLARSTLHRLELQHGARSLRRSLVAPKTALAIAASPPGRKLLLSALVLLAGRGRASRLLRGAMLVTVAVQAGRAWLRSRPHAPSDRLPTPPTPDG